MPLLGTLCCRCLESNQAAGATCVLRDWADSVALGVQDLGAAQSLAMATALEQGRGLLTASMGRLTLMRGSPCWLRAPIAW